MTGAVVDAPPLLELSGVRAAYGRIEVLHGVDLAVPEGAVVALLGPNGAGQDHHDQRVQRFDGADAWHRHDRRPVA